MFLILAAPDDLHADSVIYYLKKQQARVARLDPSQTLDADGGIRVTLQAGCSELRLPGGTIVRADDIAGIYCRNFSFPKAKPDAPIAEHLAMAESRTALQGFCHSASRARWVNNPWREAEVDNKILQHSHAAVLGLTIPDTLVTNDAAALRAFYQKHQANIIIKQMSDLCLIEEEPFSHPDGRPDCKVYGFYTHRVTEADLAAADDILRSGASPCLFQEEIPKKAELRVTVVGNRWFAHRIDSQSTPAARVDFRQVPELPVKETTIPDALGETLVRLIRSWGLVFAACDIVETPSGGHVFLEANVCGNWLWLEEGEESPIAECIAAYLLGKV
ncbi:hypothetical protein LJC23_04125 [Desulfovibrio sp. OttesenSCG-928-I05]|nr:hypothetical protein [Desulfovibrio sp. OttesenSCG-928-I05]